MAGCNKCYGGNNAEKVVLLVQKWFISQNRTLLLYVGFCPLLYFGAPSELPKKWLLCGYLSMSRFFPSTCCCTLIVKKCYRNVFLRKKRERELSFSLDKVQFRKCKKIVLSDTFFIFIIDIVDSCVKEKKKTWAMRQISKNTYAVI